MSIKTETITLNLLAHWKKNNIVDLDIRVKPLNIFTECPTVLICNDNYITYRERKFLQRCTWEDRMSKTPEPIKHEEINKITLIAYYQK